MAKRKRGAGPKVSDEDRSLHKNILTRYFEIQQYMRIISTKSDEELVDSQILVSTTKSARGRREPVAGEVQRQTMINVWALMQRAHIFEFTGSQGNSFRHEADVFTTEEYCGVPWAKQGEAVEKSLRPGKWVGDEYEPGEYEKKLAAAGLYVEFPEKLSFPVMWVAWGEGMTARPIGGVSSSSMGFLISNDPIPLVVEIMRADPNDGHRRRSRMTAAYVPVPSFGPLHPGYADYIRHPDDVTKGTWNFPSSLMPWVVTATIAAINANETFVEGRLSSLWDRETTKKWSKKIKHTLIPPPYYRVLVKPQHVVEQLKDNLVAKHHEYSHRWDCRGNYACKVLRGPLEALTDEVREKLRERKYDVWTATRRPDAAAMEILAKKRQMPPRFGEFVATMRYWRKASVKGPADRPYIPSTRKLAVRASA